MVRKSLRYLCSSASTFPSKRFTGCERSCWGVTRKIPNNQEKVWNISSHRHFCHLIFPKALISWSSVPFSPPVQMRCREVKLWDRRALNSSIGSISLSTSSGWVLHPQPSEMMALTTMYRCLTVGGWKKIYVCGLCGSWHEGFLVSTRSTWQRCDTVPPHSRVRDNGWVSAREKKVCASLHDTSIISAQGQAAGNTSARLSPVSLLAGLCSWPFLLSLFFQTRPLKGQCRAEAGLSQERGGMEGWKLNKDGRSEFSFRSLCIF